MNTPTFLALSPQATFWLALPIGAAFGVLLHRGGVADYNKIVNQFRFRDFTVLKIMLTAIIVGGVGVLVLKSNGLAQWHIKPANMLAVTLGAALFGIGMVIYGYCPGTAIAACGTGSAHAMVGFVGMLVGGALYAWTFPWVEARIQSVAALGKIRLPEVTGVPDWAWFAMLIAIGGAVFFLIERRERQLQGG